MAVSSSDDSPSFSRVYAVVFSGRLGLNNKLVVCSCETGQDQAEYC